MLLLRPFHFLRSLTVHPYFLEMELSVSPFLTVWVFVVVVFDLVDLVLLLLLELVLVDWLT